MRDAGGDALGSGEGPLPSLGEHLPRIAQQFSDCGALGVILLDAGSLSGVEHVYGAEAHRRVLSALGAVVGLSLIRELGPVLTALLVTGRAGSAMAAEIASMVTTEQLDGLRMMSVDPMDFVVRPKALAMVLVMPLLSALFIVFAVFGGYVVGVELLGVDGGTYLTSLEGSIDFSDDVAGSLVKALTFGALVGFIATYRGYTSEPTAAGVSAATTGTVVVSSIAILLSDYVITALWGV